MSSSIEYERKVSRKYLRERPTDKVLRLSDLPVRLVGQLKDEPYSEVGGAAFKKFAILPLLMENIEEYLRDVETELHDETKLADQRQRYGQTLKDIVEYGKRAERILNQLNDPESLGARSTRNVESLLGPTPVVKIKFESEEAEATGLETLDSQDYVHWVYFGERVYGLLSRDELHLLERSEVRFRVIG